MEHVSNASRQHSSSFKEEDGIYPFTISKSTIGHIIGKYLSRKFTDDIDFVQTKGGVQWLEEGLRTSIKNGISDGESDLMERVGIFDSNEPIPEDPIRFCTFVWEALQDKIIIILIICAILQTGLEVLFGENPKKDWIDGFAIVIAVTVVVLVGSINNYIKEKEFRGLKHMLDSDKFVNLIRYGEDIKTLEAEILVGDIMKIEEGMTIPVDCILMIGNNVSIDESAMTGEIDLIEKATLEECLELRDSYLSRNPEYKIKVPANSHHKIKSPIIPSGTKISSGSGLVMVLAVGPNSENGKIMATIEANKSDIEGTPLQQKLTAIANFIGKCGLIAAIATSVTVAIKTAILFTHEKTFTSSDSYYIIKIFIIGVVVIVVAIPEGLPLAVTMTLALSIKKMLKDNNFVRRMDACETMGGANFICTDKTGTLTKNEMNIICIYDCHEDLNMEEIANDNFQGTPRSHFNNREKYNLLKLCFACNTETTITNDGMETATFKTDLTFTKFLKKLGENVKEIRAEFIKEINGVYPRLAFSSKRKKMSTVLFSHSFPSFYRIFLKGASEIVLNNCDYYLNFQNKKLKITEEYRDELKAKIKTYADQALRTICIAYKDIEKEDAKNFDYKITYEDPKREVYPLEEDNMILIAVIGIRDILKDGVKDAVQKCQGAGITVVMVTGDNIDTATAIARNCAIAEDVNQSILGEKFIKKIGGVVCENCFPFKDYFSAYRSYKQDNGKAKSNTKSKSYNHLSIINGLNYKCECLRTKDEGVLKIKQKLKEDFMKSQPEKFQQMMSDKKQKEELEYDFENKARQEVNKSNIKIKKDVIANIDRFGELIERIRVIARSQPNHKYALVTGLRQLGHVVAVTGDGTNDAPALSKADVGFAMGKMGTDIAKEAADIIIVDDNFASIVNAIKWGRNIYDNIRRFLQFQLSVNICACTLVFIGVAAGSESPLSAVQMLWLNMIMDSLGSLALASEKPTDELLNRMPYKKNEFIVSKKMFKHILGQSIYQLIVLLVILFEGNRFITEVNPDMREWGYSLLKCYQENATDLIFFRGEIENRDIYLISGLESNFDIGYNSTFYNNPHCQMKFPNKTNIEGGYKHFIDEMYATTHYTLLFNTFVLMQLFNQISCRILDDSLNIFKRINTNFLFLVIWAIEFIGQVLIVEVTGPVFKVSRGVKLLF